MAVFPAPSAFYPVSVRSVQVSSPASFPPNLAVTQLPLTVRFRFIAARWELSSQSHVMSDVPKKTGSRLRARFGRLMETDFSWWRDRRHLWCL